jgi:hypothetical protein
MRASFLPGFAVTSLAIERRTTCQNRALSPRTISCPIAISRAYSGVGIAASRQARRQPTIFACAKGPSKTLPVPSGVLLLISSVLAIASVGCIFELSGGHPQYGNTITASILVVSLPGFLYLFAAAIRKGQEEAELD